MRYKIIILLIVNLTINKTFGASINQTYTGNRTETEYDITKHMLNHKLILAAKKGPTSKIHTLLDMGANVNTIDAYSGKTAITEAVLNNRIESLEALIARGANINFQNQSGNSPLMIATLMDRLKIIEILLQHEPDINATNKDGETAAEIAAKFNHPEILQMLLDRNAGYPKNFREFSSKIKAILVQAQEYSKQRIADKAKLDELD